MRVARRFTPGVSPGELRYIHGDVRWVVCKWMAIFRPIRVWIIRVCGDFRVYVRCRQLSGFQVLSGLRTHALHVGTREKGGVEVDVKVDGMLGEDGAFVRLPGGCYGDAGPSTAGCRGLDFRPFHGGDRMVAVIVIFVRS